MADPTDRNRAPALPAECAPSLPMVEVYEDSLAPFDPATLDPAEFEWRPVPRRPRADGWTPDVQRVFLQALADTGLVEEAARAVDKSVQSAYRLRQAPGGESFARAWRAALGAAAERVLDLAFTRAIQGEDTPVFDRDGVRIGARWKTNDRLTMFILRAYMPERFRHAHSDVRQPGERAPAPELPVAEALAALTPPVPGEPHRLLPPDRLEALVTGARGVAEVNALYPPDDSERYTPPRVEQSHPVAEERALARARRARERRLADAAAEEAWEDDLD